MLAFPGQAERAVLQVRSLLDGGVIATSLLYTSWSLVLGPVFRAGQGTVLEQAIVLAYPAGDVVLATIVFVVVARIRVGGAPVLLLGAGLLSLAVADSSFAYLTQVGSHSTGALSDVGWFAGYLLVAVAARRPATVGITWVGRRPGRLQILLPYCPLALAVSTSAFQQLRGQPTGPFLYWTFVILVLLIVGRQLLTVLDNQALNRRLAAMVGELEHQAFHDGLTNLPNRALFRERVAHALRRRSQAGTPLALPFIDLDDSRRSTTSSATPPATTCWSPWPAGSRPASAARTPSPALAATSSPSCSSRPPATRSRSGSPGASLRRCGPPSPSRAARSRSGPASASPSAAPPRSTPSSARPTWPCTPPRPTARAATSWPPARPRPARRAGGPLWPRAGCRCFLS
jgi:Diguanylate cyclase, GGDEF domain